MVSVTLGDIWPRRDRPLTVEDLERLQDDGNQYELVDGVLEVTLAPFSNHARFAWRLGVVIGLRCPPGLEVLEPAGVNLAEDHHRIPDLAVVRSDWVDSEPNGFIDQPPLLAVEVASKGTRKRDRTTKKREYAEFGIPSYWLAVPDFDAPSLTAYELRDGRYEQVAFAAGDESFEVTRPFGFSVTPRSLVEPGDRWKADLT